MKILSINAITIHVLKFAKQVVSNSLAIIFDRLKTNKAKKL